jgi:hypothetical protein
VVEVPLNAGEIADTRPGEARAVQQRVRKELIRILSRKLAITGFERDERSYRFLLEKYEN